MDLSVILKGQSHELKLKNPVITASGTFGSGLEFMPYGNIATLGGISVKGLSLQPRPGNATPRIIETTAGMLNSIGLQNDGVDDFINKKLPLLPSNETAIIANIYASSIDEFGQLAARLNAINGISALEVNVSCPNVKSGGTQFGADPFICASVTRIVRKNAPNKFLIIKLSPNVTDIRLIAKAAEDAGADCISCINTLLGMAVDIATRKPSLANIVGGLSGPAIKPVALRCVWQVANAVNIPVIGLGGITSVEDILEFILVGASAIQVGTANFMSPDTAFNLVNDLPAVMEKYNMHGLNDICGKLKLD